MGSKTTEQALRKYLSTPTKVWEERLAMLFIDIFTVAFLLACLRFGLRYALIPIVVLCVFEYFHAIVLVKVHLYLRRAEGTGELEDVLADFATATPAMGDRVRLGDRWLFGSASGAPVRMTDITKLYERKDNTMLEQTLLCADVAGEEHAYNLCVMPPRSRYQDDRAAVVRYVAQHAPSANMVFGHTDQPFKVGPGVDPKLAILAGMESEGETLASGHWGSCLWALDAAGTLVVFPGEGVPCDGTTPWAQMAEHITAVVLRTGVVLPTCCAGLFAGCSNLQSVNTRYWDVSHVTDLSYLFAGCGKLTTLDVSRWDTSQVTSLCCAFDGCTSLRWLDVSRWDTSRVRNMAGVFWGCRSLASLDLSQWDMRQMEDMRYALLGCASLPRTDVASVHIPDGAVATGVFDGCASADTEASSTEDAERDKFMQAFRTHMG